MSVSAPVDIVFVHGLFSNGDVWDGLFKLVREDPELSHVRIHSYEYSSPKIRFRPDRRIPDIRDLGAGLGTFLTTRVSSAEHVVLVGHSQGGLVIQQFLARTLGARQGLSLARVKHIVLFACPNNGSQFALLVRKFTFGRRGHQERRLRPLDDVISEAHATVMQAVVGATRVSESECPIFITACFGMEDNIVPKVTAASVFSNPEALPGDHFSIVRPDGRESPAYLILKRVALALPVDTSSADPVPDWPVVNSVLPPYGRLQERMHGRLRLVAAVTPEASKVHVLTGLPGAGKSRVALGIADRERSRGRQVWWVDVTRINSGMREVATQVGAPERDINQAWAGKRSPTDLVWEWLEAHDRNWLLMFDNADDPSLLASGDAPVSDGTGWLRNPATAHGMVVVTSREHRGSAWAAWMVTHRVGPLEPEDGAAVLMERAGDGAGSQEDARSLSVTLGGLPLALKCAADYLRTVGNAQVWRGDPGITTFREYRDAVAQRFRSPTGAIDESYGLEVLERTFTLSLELLASRGFAHAGNLIRLFACMAIVPIPHAPLLGSAALAESPLLPGYSPEAGFNALEALAGIGLIEPRHLPGVDSTDYSHAVAMHPIVHGILRNDEEVRAQRAEYYGLASRSMLDITREDDPDYPGSWPSWDSVAPHAVEIVTGTVLGAHPLEDRTVINTALDLARRTVRYLNAAGLLDPAEQFLDRLLTSHRRFGLRSDDRPILALRHERGRIHLERGDPAAAETELSQVVDDRTRVLGYVDVDTMASRHKFAKSIMEQGRWEEAVPLLRSIVDDEHRVRPPNHADTMVVRHTLARAIAASGNPAEAESMARDILDVRMRQWEPATPETLRVRETLAKCLHAQGKIEEAENEVSAALDLLAERPRAPEALALRYRLNVVYLDQGHVERVIEDLAVLHDDQVDTLGEGHPNTVRTVELLHKTKELRNVP